MTKSTDRPYVERLGGSYVIDPGQAEPRLVERTREPGPVEAMAPAAPPIEDAKKPAKRSD